SSVRRRPTFALFPYTTLFRSFADIDPALARPGQFIIHVVLCHAIAGFVVVSEVAEHIVGILGMDSIAIEKPGADIPEHAGVFCPDRKSTRLNSSHVSISYAVF